MLFYLLGRGRGEGATTIFVCRYEKKYLKNCPFISLSFGFVNLPSKTKVLQSKHHIAFNRTTRKISKIRMPLRYVYSIK